MNSTPPSKKRRIEDVDAKVDATAGEGSVESISHGALLCSHYGNYFNNVSLSNIVVRMGKKQYACHDLVLACGSGFFRHAILYENMKEGHDRVIDWGFPDPCNVFEIVLKYLYSGSLTFTVANVIGVSALANQLEIPSLSEAALTYVKKTLAIDSAKQILEAAFTFPESEQTGILPVVMSYIAENFSAFAEEHRDFLLQLPVATLTNILISDDLMAQSEDDVYHVISDYISSRSNDLKPEEIESLWHPVRFFELSTDVFREATEKNTSIPAEWKPEMYIATIRRLRNEDITSSRFINASPRPVRRNPNPVFLVSRVAKGSEDMARRWGYNGTKIDAIKFIADRDVLLVAIGVYGSVRASQPEYTAKLEVMRGETVLVAKTFTYTAASPSPHFLELDEPVLLPADQTIQVELTITGHVSYAIGLGSASVTVDDFTIRFIDAELAGGKSTNHTDISRGQMPAFKFQYPYKK